MTKPPKPIKIGMYLDAVYPAYAMLAGIQLDIFTHLKDGGRNATQLADALDVNGEKLSRLLYALVVAELLTLEDGVFSNSEEADFYLVKGKPTYLGEIHPLISDMWSALPFSAETIRTGIPQAQIDYQDADAIAEEARVFAGLHAASLMAIPALLKRVDLAAHQHIIDIGGGSGGVAIGLTRAFPELQVTIYDLPTVTPITAQYVETAPTKDRIHIVSGNAVDAPIIGSYDGAIMRAFTQVLSPAQNQAVFKHTFDALAPGSTLYILAQMVDDSRIYPAPAALMNTMFLNIYDEGRAYTESEYRGWLTQAGFSDIQINMPPRNDSLIIATRS